MKAIFIYLSDFLVLTSAAVISPLDLTNTSGLVSNVANRPTVGTPDRRFKIDVSFHAPKIPLISTLQNTVEFLEILGLKDFSGSMEGVAWKLNDYPEVGMVISPSTQREYIYLPFVIWGLSQGVAHMIHLNRFQAVTFTLSWAGEEVGTIELVDWPANQDIGRSTHINSTQNLPQRSHWSTVKSSSGLSIFSNNTNIKGEDLDNEPLTVRAMLTGSRVPLFDVFLLAIAVLVDAARLESTQRLQTYVSPESGGGVEIMFGQPVPARTSPPFFEVQYLMRAVVLIPNYMIIKGVFKEALVLVEVGGVRVADGFLGQKQAAVGLTNVNYNVSVS